MCTGGGDSDPEPLVRQCDSMMGGCSLPGSSNHPCGSQVGTHLEVTAPWLQDQV